MKKLFKFTWKHNYLIYLAIITTGAIFSIRLTGIQEALQFDAKSYYLLGLEIASQKLNLINILAMPRFIDLGYPLILSFLNQIFGNVILIYQIFNFLFWFLATIFVYIALKLVTNGKQAFFGALVMACSPIYFTFSAKLYSEPFASLGLSMIVYFLLKYKLGKSLFSLWGVLLGMLIFFFTKSVYSLLIIPIIFLSLTRRSVDEYLILILSMILVIVGLYFSIGSGRSNYNLAIQSAKIHQPYSAIGACSLYYLSYPVGKFVFPKFEGICHQNDPKPYMFGYDQNPYILTEGSRDSFGFGSWLGVILSNPIKYLTVMLSSMTSVIFVEGIYANITEHFNSIPAVILFGGIKVAFAIYIWRNTIKNFKIFLKYGFGIALLSLMPLIYFFLIVGNYPVEQRYFFPLMPWVYFYTALDKKSITRVVGAFVGR
jgi:hypothetical protein